MAKFYNLAMSERYDIYPGPDTEDEGAPVDDVSGMDAMQRNWPQESEAWIHGTEKFDGYPESIAYDENPPATEKE